MLKTGETTFFWVQILNKIVCLNLIFVFLSVYILYVKKSVVDHGICDHFGCKILAAFSQHVSGMSNHGLHDPGICYHTSVIGRNAQTAMLRLYAFFWEG